MNIGNNMVSIHFFTGCQGVLPWMAATSHHGFIPGPQTRRVGSPVMEPIVKNACGEWSGNWLSIQAIVKQRVKWVILSCFSLFVPALHIFASLMFFIFQNNLPRTAHLYCQTSLFCALESSSPAWCNQPPLTALGDVNRSSTSLGKLPVLLWERFGMVTFTITPQIRCRFALFCTRDLSLTISGNYITYPRKKRQLERWCS